MPRLGVTKSEKKMILKDQATPNHIKIKRWSKKAIFKNAAT